MSFCNIIDLRKFFLCFRKLEDSEGARSYCAKLGRPEVYLQWVSHFTWQLFFCVHVVRHLLGRIFFHYHYWLWGVAVFQSSQIGGCMLDSVSILVGVESDCMILGDNFVQFQFCRLVFCCSDSCAPLKGFLITKDGMAHQGSWMHVLLLHDNMGCLLHRLLDMYLKPGEGREPMHDAAVRLLHCHGASLDPLKVLEVRLQHV